MLIQEKLEKLAELAIPNKTHQFLHVNCREAWVKRVKTLIKKKVIKANAQNLKILAENWETLLFNYYGTQN